MRLERAGIRLNGAPVEGGGFVQMIQMIRDVTGVEQRARIGRMRGKISVVRSRSLKSELAMEASAAARSPGFPAPASPPLPPADSPARGEGITTTHKLTIANKTTKRRTITSRISLSGESCVVCGSCCLERGRAVQAHACRPLARQHGTHFPGTISLMSYCRAAFTCSNHRMHLNASAGAAEKRTVFPMSVS